MINNDGFEFLHSGEQHRFIVNSGDEVVVQKLDYDALGVEGWHKVTYALSGYVTPIKYRLVEHHIRAARREDFKTQVVFVVQHRGRRLLLVESEPQNNFHMRSEVACGDVWESVSATHYDLFARAALDHSTVSTRPLHSIPAWTDNYGAPLWRFQKRT